MVTQVRQFVGFASYYRKFIPDFSEIVQPLTRLTKKSIRFCWCPSCQKAFDTLKEKLATPPVLAYPRSEGEYILDTDASNHAIGAVLSQIQDGEERVIAYASRALQGGQKNYCTTKREIWPLSLLWSIFAIICTVQNSPSELTMLLWNGSVNSKTLMAFWLDGYQSLNSMTTQLSTKKGPRHVNADSLSRLPIKKWPRTDCPHCTMKICKVTAQQLADDTDEWLVGWSDQDLLDWQRKDLVLARVIGWLEKSP